MTDGDIEIAEVRASELALGLGTPSLASESATEPLSSLPASPDAAVPVLKTETESGVCSVCTGRCGADVRDLAPAAAVCATILHWASLTFHAWPTWVAASGCGMLPMPRWLEWTQAGGGCTIAKFATAQVAWEDVSRLAGSSLGSNITDLTLGVYTEGGIVRAPLLRLPNFSDITCDVPVSQFEALVVGNEETYDMHLGRVSLRDYLEHLERHSGVRLEGRILRGEDEKVLVSAQACILPDGRDTAHKSEGAVEFVPTLFN